MAEFICKDELKRRIETQEPCTFEELEQLIDDVPVLDVEMLLDDNFERRIVRCKDCKKYKPFENENFPCGECGNCSYDVPPRIMGDNDYCSDGERKEKSTMVKCSECEHISECKAKKYNDDLAGCSGWLHTVECLPETEVDNG